MRGLSGRAIVIGLGISTSFFTTILNVEVNRPASADGITLLPPSQALQQLGTIGGPVHALGAESQGVLNSARLDANGLDGSQPSATPTQVSTTTATQTQTPSATATASSSSTPNPTVTSSSTSTPAPTTTSTPTTLPASVDLSQYNPPVGYQGAIQSCVSWVTGYYMRSWYARRDGYYPGDDGSGNGGFAPMSIYHQVTNSANVPSTFNDNFNVEMTNGIAARANYDQGNTSTGDSDYTHHLTAAESENASGYKISGFNIMFQGDNQGYNAQRVIETTLAGGDPVGIIIPVYQNFYGATAAADFIDGNPGTYYGEHATFATKYDVNGLWIENQWGTSWGLNGWVELSWSFVNRYAIQAAKMSPTQGRSPEPTYAPPPATPLPSNTPTTTPTATPMSTAQARPSANGASAGYKITTASTNLVTFAGRPIRFASLFSLSGAAETTVRRHASVKTGRLKRVALVHHQIMAKHKSLPRKLHRSSAYPVNKHSHSLIQHRVLAPVTHRYGWL